MKKITFTLILCGLVSIAKSQNGGVEKSTFGVQTGFLGVWAYNEAKLSNLISLRSEIGLDSGFWNEGFYRESGYVITPVITLEPRWYYNLNRRIEKNKQIDGNSGNFISLKTSHHPDWFVISNYENIRIVNDILIIPTWGIRRNIGDHFNYEAGIGIGYAYYFAKSAGYISDKSEVAVNLHVRIGYKF